MSNQSGHWSQASLSRQAVLNTGLTAPTFYFLHTIKPVWKHRLCYSSVEVLIEGMHGHTSTLNYSKTCV